MEHRFLECTFLHGGLGSIEFFNSFLLNGTASVTIRSVNFFFCVQNYLICSLEKNCNLTYRYFKIHKECERMEKSSVIFVSQI